MAAFEPRFAITFGEVAILHVGGAKFGAERRSEGFSVDELRGLRDLIEGAELTMVSDVLPAAARAANEAAVLVIPSGAEFLGLDSDRLLDEQKGVVYDQKYFDSRRRGTLNKRARYNVVFGDGGQVHSEDYQDPTVVPFAGLPLLDEFRGRLPEAFGPKAAGLNAEGNYYFGADCGIGFHGDAERKIVICLSLGGPATLRYHWRLPGSSDHTFPSVDVAVGHGAVYCMSEKATGWDWKYRSKTRVVHAAGSLKYIGV